MRHRKKEIKFGRKKDTRKAFIRSLVVALIENEHISTTEARAKAIKSKVEKLVSVAKKDTLLSAKQLHSYLPKKTVSKIKELGKKYKERPGGYTRISKIAKRSVDRAKMAIIEFV